MFPRIPTRPVYGLGLDMSQSFLHLLEIKMQSGGCYISNCACFAPSEEIPESTVLNSVDCALALNDNDLVSMSLSIRPGLDSYGLEMLVWYEVEKFFSLPASQLLIDYYTKAPQKTQDTMIDLIILASRKPLLDEAYNLPVMSQLSIKCIDIDSHALARAMVFIANQDNLQSDKSLVLIYFNKTHFQFIRVRDDEPQLIQHTRYENPQHLTDTLIDCFKLTQEGSNDVHCYLAGDFDYFEELVDCIEQKTAWSVSIANPLTLFNIKNNHSDDFIKIKGPAFLLAFGLALRGNQYESH